MHSLFQLSVLLSEFNTVSGVDGMGLLLPLSSAPLAPAKFRKLLLHHPHNPYTLRLR